MNEEFKAVKLWEFIVFYVLISMFTKEFDVVNHLEQYFGIKLHLFQKIIIHMMHKSNYFCWIACRGLGAENVEKSTN